MTDVSSTLYEDAVRVADTDLNTCREGVNV